MAGHTGGFLGALWQSVRPDILAQYRDAVITANMLGIIAVLHLIFRLLEYIHLDQDLLSVLWYLHKWATVVVFATFLWTLIVRSSLVAYNAAFQKREG
jgi:hypothetical protein